MATVFDQLEEFLPKHVSPIPSYLHGLIACAVSFIVTQRLGARFLESSESDSKTEDRVKKYTQIACSALVGILLFDTVFNISFKVRGFRTNKRHFTYRHWFPKLYT